MAALVIDARVTIPDRDLTWTAVRSSGPGGQNVNKVSSKVELRFDLRGCQALDPLTKLRLAALAAGRVNSLGELIVVSSLTRDRERNLADARGKLAALVRRALERPRPRRPTRPSAAAKDRRIAGKRHRSATKRRRTGLHDD